MMFEPLSRRYLLAGDVALAAPMAEGEASEIEVGQMAPPIAAHHSDVAHSTSSQSSAHMAAMNLATAADATHSITASGDWSDPAIWSNSELPGDGARVFIPEGLTLTVDGVIAESLYSVRIDGELRFATTVDTELRVDTIVSSQTGHLVMGTESNPIAEGVQARVLFTGNGEIDRTADPDLLSRGAILHGKTTIHGAAKTSWTSLAEQPLAGAAELVLSEAPTGWRVGDQLVVAGTDPNDPTSDEVLRIQAIDGATVTLDAPLQRDHVAPVAGLQVHVANTTRNVVFRSENEAIELRGHVMFMHTLDVDVNYAAFEQLGRTDKRIPLNDSIWHDLEPDRQEDLGGSNVRGRYSVHFHRGGVDPNSQPARVHGSVVVDDSGWAYVNHSAHVDFTENVSYNTVGAAYNTEAGNEIGSFINNLAIRSVNPADPLNQPLDEEDPFKNTPDGREGVQDYGWQGDGFWFHGPHVRVEGNVVTGASGHAYIWWPEGLLEKGLGENFADVGHLPGGDLIGPAGTKVEIWNVPVKTFSNNQAYSATKGIQIYYLHSNFFDGGEEGKGLAEVPESYKQQLNSTFSDSTLWGIRQSAIAAPYASRLTFENIRLVGGGEANSVGLDLGHHFNESRFELNNLDISGFETGVITPTAGNVNISGGAFANATDLLIKNPERGSRAMAINDVTFAALPDSLADRADSRENIRLAADFNPNGFDGFEETPKDPLFFLQPDQISLNFGPHENAQLYFNEQAADFIPVSAENPIGGSGVEVPQQFVGRTNGELAAEFNMAFGGALLPEDALAAYGISGGLVGSPAEMLSPPPELDDDNEDSDEDEGEEDLVEDDCEHEEDPGEEEEQDDVEQDDDEEDSEEDEPDEENDQEDDEEDGEDEDENEDEDEDGGDGEEEDEVDEDEDGEEAEDEDDPEEDPEEEEDEEDGDEESPDQDEGDEDGDEEDGDEEDGDEEDVEDEPGDEGDQDDDCPHEDGENEDEEGEGEEGDDEEGDDELGDDEEQDEDESDEDPDSEDPDSEDPDAEDPDAEEPDSEEDADSEPPEDDQDEEGDDSPEEEGNRFDVSGDGQVNLIDAFLAIERFIRETFAIDPLAAEDSQNEAGFDMNSDQRTNVLDVLLLLAEVRRSLNLDAVSAAGEGEQPLLSSSPEAEDPLSVMATDSWFAADDPFRDEDDWWVV